MPIKRKNQDEPTNEQSAAKRRSVAILLDTILALDKNKLHNLKHGTLVNHVTELQLAHQEVRELANRFPSDIFEIPADSPFIATILVLPQVVFKSLSKSLLVDYVTELRKAHEELRRALECNGVDLDEAQIDVGALVELKEVRDLAKVVHDGIRNNLIPDKKYPSRYPFTFHGSYTSLSVLEKVFNFKGNNEQLELKIQPKALEAAVNQWPEYLKECGKESESSSYEVTVQILGPIKFTYSPKDKTFTVTGTFTK